MLRIAIVVAACASSAATLEGSADQKASILRQKATAVTKTRKLAACTGTSDWSCVDTTTCRKFDANAVGYEQVRAVPCGYAALARTRRATPRSRGPCPPLPCPQVLVPPGQRVLRGLGALHVSVL